LPLRRIAGGLLARLVDGRQQLPSSIGLGQERGMRMRLATKRIHVAGDHHLSSMLVTSRISGSSSMTRMIDMREMFARCIGAQGM
jgi:hypothetical protein